MMSGDDFFKADHLNGTYQESFSNGSGSGSGSGSGFLDDEHEDYFIATCISFSMKVIGIIVNLLTICYFIASNKKNLRKMSTYHFLLLHLALIDLLVCVCKTPSYLEDGLKLIPISDFGIYITHISGSFHLQSMFGLFYVSFLRYQSIVHPFQVKWSKRRYFFIILATLILSLAGTIPDVLSYALDFSFGYYFILADATISFVFLVILISLYFKMSKALRESQESRSKERNKNALKTLRILLILFAVTMVFSKIIFLCLRFLIPDDVEMTDEGITILYILEVLMVRIVYVNNIANFFVYLRMMPEFRRFMRNIMCCYYFRQTNRTG